MKKAWKNGQKASLNRDKRYIDGKLFTGETEDKQSYAGALTGTPPKDIRKPRKRAKLSISLNNGD